MTRPGIEPRSPGPLANTLTAGPMSRLKLARKFATHIYIYIYICMYVCMCVCVCDKIDNDYIEKCKSLKGFRLVD